MAQDSYKALNINTIYELILSRKLLSKKEIQRITTYSWGTVSCTVNRLLEYHFIDEIDAPKSIPGRPPKYYQINPNRFMFIGMDIGSEYIRIALTGADNRILFSDTTPISAIEQHYIINVAILFLKNFIHRHDLENQSILGLGISIVFSSNRKTGVPLFPPYIKGWNSDSLLQTFREQFSFPVSVAHTSNCLALAELLKRPDDMSSNIFFVNIDMDLSTSMLLDGYIHPDYKLSSEFGHIAVYDTEDNSYRRLQDICSINGIASDYRRHMLVRDILSADELDRLSSGEICNNLYQQACSGESEAQKYFRKAGYFLGIGISHILNIINPDTVILGGTFMNYSDLFLPETVRIARQYAYKYSSNNIQPAVSNKYGAAVGASALFQADRPWRRLLEQI